MAEVAGVITLLHVIDTGGPGGAETVFLNTTTRLDSAEFRSLCMVSRDGWLANALRAQGIEPRIVPASGSMNLGYLRTLLRTIRENKVDLVVAHLYGSAIYCSLAGVLSGVPVVSILHGQSDLTRGGRLDGLKKLLVRRSRKLVFVSEKLRGELATALGASRAITTVIPNGVEIEKFSQAGPRTLREELRLPGDAILVGSIGNIRVPKAYDVLLRAAHLLRQRSPRYHFAIAGEGGNALHEQLLALRHELGLDQAVTFLGLRGDVAELLSSFDVFALSSRTEGFSLACVEAMSAGVPVVATLSGGPEEIVENGVSGLLVPVQDPAALAEGITRVAEDPGLAARMRERARQRVLERFTLAGMVGAYRNLFYSVVAPDSGR